MSSDTSEGTLLSSLHGAYRREHRSISKLDLRSVKKYGTKERTYANGKPRWKFIFSDIVYITEDDEISEVTSYVRPLTLSKAILTPQDIQTHEALVQKLKIDPTMLTSHTVIVIDQSASMRTCDVDNYKTRSDAVFASVAVDYVGKQIDDRTISNAQYTDVVTVIEMNEYSKIIFEREPCTNVLYNKLLDRKAEVNPHSHGMFKHAIDLALHVLLKDVDNDSYPLQLWFLSDGKPSDYSRDIYYDPGYQIQNLCSFFKERLMVNMLGFGKKGSDFSVLEEMARCATLAGSIGTFKAMDLRGDDLTKTIENLSNTLSQTRQMCSALHNMKGPRTARVIAAEPVLAAGYNFDTDIDRISPEHWDIYQEGCNIWAWRNRELRTVGSCEGVAICKETLGTGAERIVFRLREFKMIDGVVQATEDRLIAKECKWLEDVPKQSKFHEKFCLTQSQAASLARKFNASVAQRCQHARLSVDVVISFLPCQVYQVPVTDAQGRAIFRSILVEKRLDPSKYMKWNSNNGFVRGLRSAADVLNWVPRAAPAAAPVHMDIIEEGDSDEERSEYADEDEEEDHLIEGKSGGVAISCSIKLEDYPQAFSHWTYRYTKRSKLVCDLQGVLDTSVTPAVFELTDPVIHWNSSSKRKKVFGNTDHGRHGINQFFKTHVCNDLCRLLGFQGYN